MIGVNSDGGADSLKEIEEREKITWRNAVDVGPDGPIATRWNVNAWPTIYILDAKGVIRYRDARGEEMGKAVEELLKEIEKE